MVSARPSDAVALAVRVRTTIYAEEELLDAEGVILPDEEQEPAESGGAGVGVPGVHRRHPPRGLRVLSEPTRGPLDAPMGPAGPVAFTADFDHTVVTTCL